MKILIRTFALLLFVGTFLSTAHSQRSEKVTVLWCDPLLNVRDIHSRRGITQILDKMQSVGIGAIALGVKAKTGEVLYNSNVAPRLTEWEDYRVPLDIDPIQTFLDEGRARRIQVYAVFSVFSEGHTMNRQGLVYENHTDWQSQVYVVENDEPKIMPITDWHYTTTALVNPVNKEAQDYEASIITEFLNRYTVDGIILEKIGFSGIESDFSELTKSQFEEYLGRTVQWWPQDVYELRKVNDEWEITRGSYFEEWIQFRARNVHRFVQNLVADIRTVDPALPVGKFVGGWYPTYYEYGVNWASETTVPEGDWATPDYYKTAVAEMLDYLVVGCYFPRLTIEETEKEGAEWWMSAEGSAMLSMEVVNNVCPVYGSILLELFKNDTARLKKALAMVMSHTNGLYIYDLSHVEGYQLWDEIKEVLSTP